MIFRTTVTIPKPDFEIQPRERMLFVGSCFADSIGGRFADEKFDVTVNPYGVMYNPASVLHSVERWAEHIAAGWAEAPRVAVFTLGTNHVYILRETGEIVDNCRKRPQRLFREEVLTVEQCAGYLRSAAGILKSLLPDVRIILTVSPIRYAKYGFHGSALSKATLLLAADMLEREMHDTITYFPAYEILNDELRDYRFYAPDMIHPSQQAVDYIWELFSENFFSSAAKDFVAEWQPIKQALNHRPFNPESEEYRRFMEYTKHKLEDFNRKYGITVSNE